MMRKNILMVLSLALTGALAFGGMTLRADQGGDNNGTPAACQGLPNWQQLKNALTTARNGGSTLGVTANGGLELDMWGSVVNRDGIVCAVAFTGGNRGDQWPGSRVISAQKANTANAFSLPGLALSTANLYTATQPGGSLFGLQLSNPVSTDAAYGGNPAAYGTAADPMVGTRIGGVNVFGGGLALYNSSGTLLGALGVSGDTSCADHNIAWKARDLLGLDFVPAGVNATADPSRKDNIIFDITPQAGQMPGVSAGGFGHASCHGVGAAANDASRGYADADSLPTNN
jgi:uncharacterized protein GlcG (DUF336 family)